MRTPQIPLVLFASGIISAAALLLTASSTHAQGFSRLNPGAAAGTPFPTLGWRPGVGGRNTPNIPSNRGQATLLPPRSPYTNAYGGGGYSMPPRQYGGRYGGAPGGYYGGYPSQDYARSYGGNARILGSLPDNRVNVTRPPVRQTPGGRATLSVVMPPTAPVNNRTNFNNGDGGASYYPPTYYTPPTYFTGGPPLLGGYYYGGYCDDADGPGVYPSVYGDYDGLPSYIDNIAPGVIVVSPPIVPAYVTDPEPFAPPTYEVTYNQNNYYVTSADSAGDIEQGGQTAQSAVKRAYPADSYQAAFADIERSWDNGDVSLLKKHLRSDDTKISVSLKSAYKYSLNSSDFAQITRDAFDRLNTVSFKFTALQKAKNGDVTAYGTHVYQPESSAGVGAVVPFDTDAAASDGDAGDADTSEGTGKTVYVSYTLRHGDAGWYVTAINSSTEPLLTTAQ